MQDRLFPDEQTVEFDDDFDPYAEVDAEAAKIAAEYGISVEEAVDTVLARGSASAARRALNQRWLLGEIAEAA